MSVHLNIKAKVVLSADAKQELKATMEEFNRGCNIAAELAFQQDVQRKYDLHHAAYNLLRKETNLPAQHVINAIAKVSGAYLRDSSVLHVFKTHSAMRFDARTMVLGQDCYTVALTICPKGRITGQLQMSNKMRKQLRSGKLGSAELVYRNGQFYLHISLTVETPEPPPPTGTLGVDKGVKQIAVTSDNQFFGGRKARHIKQRYQRTRRSLQANGSKSAKRVLKRVSSRETNFMQDVNHCVSKQIVQTAKENNQRIVLEDLTGIRKTGQAQCVHDWAFFQLDAFIEYKAKQAGVEVVYIPPAYTSRMCYRCLHLGQRPNQATFACANCGKYSADLNAAKVIAIEYDLIAMGRFFCDYPQKQVNRPEAVRRSVRQNRQARNLELQAPPRARFGA